MPRSDEHAYEGLIRESERILQDAGVIHQESESTTEDRAAARGRQELASLKAAEGESADGYADIRISEDRMMAAASFYPPVGAGRPVEFLEVQELMIAKGLRFGISWDTVRSSVLACNTSRKAHAGVEVARGRRPTDEIGPRLEVEPALPQEGDSGESRGAGGGLQGHQPFPLREEG